VVGETVAERYELEELVGHGGMSSVYRARDSLLERYVALKVLHEQYSEDDDFVERFKREARSVAQLQHPNIVTVIDRGEQGGRQYIVFEYVEGENLKELVVRKGRLEVREALEVAIEVARALGFAHQHGIVHRDVKPQNVLLNGDGRPKVTDFGIARSLDMDQGVTQTGTVLGTSNYIAPEQASGKPVDQQSDIYSLGVVLYELLTGELPFPGESFVAVALKHVNDPPPSVLDIRRDVPLRVAQAVDRALEKDPERRFGTMDDFASELETCLVALDRGDDGDITMVVPASQRMGRPPKRRRSVPYLPLGIGLVALLAVAGIVIGLLTIDGSNGGGNGNASVGTPISLTGAGAYDPLGDNHAEHDAAAPRATDDNRGTYWYTENYNDAPSLGKPGVGLVLDAHAPTQVSRIVLQTDTAGFTAQIRATNTLGGAPQPVSDSKVVSARTVFDVRTSGGPKRYYVIWITRLPSDTNFAHINGVRAFGG
jgi:predicted Ser/Thr protein kinase